VTTDDLLADLDADLLRGVALHSCLSGLGKYWSNNSNYDQARRLTFPTDFFNDFLSHDWGTSVWLKYLSLLIYYNATAAVTASTLISAFLGICVAYEVLPAMNWLPSLGYGVFLALLFFWQHLRRIFWKPMVVFLDKLCIPQNDEELKARCIFGLAGFLDRAETLVVLWSPRYFCRLWCTYEIATWLKNRRTVKPVVFVPVQISILFIICFVVVSCVQITTTIARTMLLQSEVSAEESWSADTIFFLIACNVVMACVLLPMCFNFWTEMFKDVAELNRQLSAFRVQDTQCFCCTHKHRDPTTGHAVQCDRELIYGVLQKWYGTGYGGMDYLDVFNSLVREQLATPIERKLQDNTLLLQYLARAGLASLTPWLANLIPMWTKILSDEGPAFAFRNIGAEVYLVLLVFTMLHVSMLIGKAGVELRASLNRTFLACCQAMFEVLMALMLWFPFSITVFMTDVGSYLPFLPLGTLFLANVYLYWPGFSRQGKNAFQRASFSRKEIRRSPSPPALQRGPSTPTLDIPRALVSPQELNEHDLFSI